MKSVLLFFLVFLMQPDFAFSYTVEGVRSPVKTIDNSWRPSCHRSDYGLQGGVKYVKSIIATGNVSELFFDKDGMELFKGEVKCRTSQLPNGGRLVEVSGEAGVDTYVFYNDLPVQITFADSDSYFEFSYSGSRFSGGYTQTMRALLWRDSSVAWSRVYKFGADGKIVEQVERNSNLFFKFLESYNGVVSISTTRFLDGFVVEDKTIYDNYARYVSLESYNTKAASRTISSCSYQVDDAMNWIKRECDRRSYLSNGEVRPWSQPLVENETRQIFYY